MSRTPSFNSQWHILLAALQSSRAWRSLNELHALTGIRETSLSAQLRNLRKESFGGHTVRKRRLKGGEWEYKLG